MITLIRSCRIVYGILNVVIIAALVAALLLGGMFDFLQTYVNNNVLFKTGRVPTYPSDRHASGGLL